MAGKRFIQFDNFAGTYHLRLEQGEDLRALQTLGEAFWMATSAPIRSLRCDPRLLHLLDRDQDGRIRSSDIRHFVSWACTVLTNLEAFTSRSDVLEFRNLREDNVEGRQLLEAAMRLLKGSSEHPPHTLTLAQIRDPKATRVLYTPPRDGLVTAERLDDPTLVALLDDVIMTQGSIKDAAGLDGVTLEKLTAFREGASKVLAWRDRRMSVSVAGLMPFTGSDVDCAYAVVEEVRSKVDQWFHLSQLFAVNASLGRETQLPPMRLEFESAVMDLAGRLEAAPIAPPAKDGCLRFAGEMNAFWRVRLEKLRQEVLEPILGVKVEAITQLEWQGVIERFEGLRRWYSQAPAVPERGIDQKRLAQYQKNAAYERLGERLKVDRTRAEDLGIIEQLELLILMQQYFLELCNNFVSFPNLYTPGRRAMFEMGRLIMDRRIFEFNLWVNDVEQHAQAATRAGIFLLYSEISGHNQPCFFIVTPVTSGQIGSLGVNKRGIFQDIEGQEWDAVVVRVVEHPISIRDAMLSPIRRLARLLTTATEQSLTTAETELAERVRVGVTEARSGTIGILAEATRSRGKKGGATPSGTIAISPVSDPPTNNRANSAASRVRDLLVSGSVTVAALGSAYAFVARSVSDLTWQILAATFLFGLTAVLVPTFFSAIVKLRQRDLGCLLEASGWAVNGHMRLTTYVGLLFTITPRHADNMAMRRLDRARDLYKRSQ